MSPNHADRMANSVDPYQTAPRGAVRSGSALLAQTHLSQNLGSLWHQVVMIDVDKAFHDSRKNIIGRYYDSDSIHLSSSGVKRLLNAIK